MTELTPEPCGIRTAALRFSLVYWGGIYLFLGLLWTLAGSGPVGSGIDRLLLFTACPAVTAIISIALVDLHERLVEGQASEKALPVLVAVAFVLSLAAALVWAGLGSAMHDVWSGGTRGDLDGTALGYDMAYGTSLFFGWSCLLITLVFGFELNDRARRLAAIREEALTAQMRALRYQVNPHFLFNTLNSIAGLIEEGSPARAERMMLSLSNFLRTTLSLDPTHDVPLAEEVSLQADYLEIERERFADRMVLAIDMSEDVRDALVPSLILQPLIENAIKHGVGMTNGPVEIALRARRDGDRLHVVVENDMPATGTAVIRRPGMGVGQRNIAERLRARFGGDSQFAAGPALPGRYRASIQLPLRLA